MRSLALAVLALCVGGTQAAGFALYEHSASALGNAFAGQAVAARDASTLFANPAGLTEVTGRQVVAGLHLIAPSAQFSDAGGAASGGDAGSLAAVPSFYYAMDLNRDFKLGLGLFAPFGLKTEYDSGWAGSEVAILSDMRTVNLNPTLAWRVNDRLALGLGLDYQFIEATLSKEPFGVPTTMQGDDTAWGYNLGLLYRVDEATRVGLSYRSRLDYRLTGTVRGLLNGDIYADVTLPDMASLAVQHRLDERWSLLADATWTGWGVFDRLDAYLASGAGPIDHTDESWQDAWRFGLGFDYRHNDTWTWRFGVAYDQTPIPDAGHRTPRVPDADRVSVAAGGQYASSKRTRVDFGYMHIFFRDVPISTPAGRYASHADVLGVQLSHNY